MKLKSFMQICVAVFLLSPVTVFPGEWTLQNPAPHGNNLFGVWGNSGSDVFAVGASGTIVHY